MLKGVLKGVLKNKLKGELKGGRKEVVLGGLKGAERCSERWSKG